MSKQDKGAPLYKKLPVVNASSGIQLELVDLTL
jgi:hypothetical protein